MKSIVSAILLASIASAAVASGAGTLTVGNPAPAISVDAWIKGKPVTEFQKGKIYVVDFFATWCPPCNRSMPHLSQIASKYKDKVQVIGVDVRENDEGPAVSPGKEMDDKVASFVKGKGDDMAYTVCTDDVNKSMMTNWMTASGEHGIPCVFVVDQNGNIANIVLGYSPKDNRLETTIDQLLAGTFDYKAAAAQHRAQTKS